MAILDVLSNPGLWNAIGSVGEGLQSASQGRAANQAPYMANAANIQQQRRADKARERIFGGGAPQQGQQGQQPQPGILGQMDPRQRQTLEAIYEANPQAAMEIIAQQQFPEQGDPTARYKVVGGRLVDLLGPGGPSVAIGAEPKQESIGARYKVVDGQLIDLMAEGGPSVAIEGQPNLPGAVNEYNYAVGQGYQGTFEDWKKQNKGGVTVNTGGPDVVKLTEGQSKLALFGNMMKSAMPVIDKLETEFNPANLSDALAEQAGLPGNFVKSDEYKAYKSAANMWLEGILRLATGAAATQPEIDRLFQTYFAQPGDDPGTIEFKQKQRKEAAAAVQQASGGLVNPNDPNSPGIVAPAAPTDMSDDELRKALGW